MWFLIDIFAKNFAQVTKVMKFLKSEFFLNPTMPVVEGLLRSTGMWHMRKPSLSLSAFLPLFVPISRLDKIGGISTTNRVLDLLSNGFLLPTGIKKAKMSSVGMKLNKKSRTGTGSSRKKRKKEAGWFPKKISPIRKHGVSKGNWPPEENEGENFKSFLRSRHKFECLTLLDDFLSQAILYCRIWEPAHF